MVHALQKAHALLKPGGRLVEMEGLPDMRWLQVHAGEQVIPVGLLQDEVDPYLQHIQQALAQVVQDGLFDLEAQRIFDCYTYAGSLDELREYMKGIIIADRQVREISKIIAHPPG